jgi:hypothetical protein
VHADRSLNDATGRKGREGGTSEEGTVKRTKGWLRRRRALYPAVLPFYLLPPTRGNLVFDPSLRRARDEHLR